MLAEALCKLEGFTYAPSDTVYWQHGHSTERDFIYVTTARPDPRAARSSSATRSGRTARCSCSAPPSAAKADRYPEPDGQEDSQGRCSPAASGATTTTACKVENLPKAPPPEGQMDSSRGLGKELAMPDSSIDG